MANTRETCHCVRMHNLPEEVLERIMSYLSPYNDCKNASLVSKKWHRLMRGVVKQRLQVFGLAARAGSLQWSHQWSEGGTMTGRFKQSTCCVDGIMYIFGGAVPSYANDYGTCYCDLWKLDLGQRTWTRLMATGEYPSPKAAASFVHHNGSLLLYGGWAPPVPRPPHQRPQIFDDLHIYDIACNHWRSVVSSVSPPPMANHRASMVGDLMVIFGGGTNGNRKKEDNVWVLSLQSMTWSCMEMKEIKPPPRDKHVQVVLDDGHILIIGGLGNFDKVLGDVWMLDISEVPWCWREVDIEHQEHAAPKIFSHAACKIGDCVVFFSSLRPGSSAGISHALAPIVRPPQPARPAMRSQSRSSPSHQGGVERGSLRDLHIHRWNKCPCNKASDDSVTQSHNSEPSDSSEPLPCDTNGDCSTGQSPIGCPCSPECQCKMPVTRAVLAPVEVDRIGRIHKAPATPGSSTLHSKIPQGEQQYVLDIRAAVSDSRVEWLGVPDVNAKRRPMNPAHEDAKLRYGHAPEAFFPSVCVGRAEIVRFGGMLNDKRLPRVMNCQYFAY